MFLLSSGVNEWGPDTAVNRRVDEDVNQTVSASSACDIQGEK